MVGVLGFSFSGQGQNAGLAFVTLKDWDEREGAGHSAQALAGRAFGALSGIRDAFIFPLCPPPIPELGTATGFTFRLQDRGGNGHDALLAARNQLLGMAAQSKVLAGVRPDGLEDAPQLQLDIDRDKANALGVSLRRDQQRAVDRARLDLRQRLPERRPPAARGRAGRRARRACSPTTCCASTRVNSQGQPVPLSAFATHALDHRRRCRPSATTATRRCASPATPRRATAPATAMAEMERLAAQLPPGFGFEWTGQSREEKLAGAQALHPVRLLAAGGVPVPGRAVRELVDPARR